MVTEAPGEEEVDSESITENVSENGEYSDQQDDAFREDGKFTDKVRKKRPLGYQEVEVATVNHVSQRCVQQIGLPPKT